MHVTLQYETQLKRVIGIASETVEVCASVGIAEVVQTAAARHPESVQSLLLDAEGRVRPSLLVFVGNQQWSRDDATPLSDGETLILMSPISGG